MSESKPTSRNYWALSIISLVASLVFFLLISFDIVTLYQSVAFLLMVLCGGLFFTLTLINLSNNQKPKPIQLILVTIVLAAAATTYLHRNGAFYGSKIVDATFLDERSRMDMYLYEDGHYIITSGWILGSETFTGTYRKAGNTITFNKYPVVDTDFIDKTITIKGNKIYFNKSTPDTSYYSFKINKL